MARAEEGAAAAPIVVPEPEVKAALAARGVAVPAGVVVAPGGNGAGARRLREPLVLKAFGPGIVHKSDLGAVALGLDHGGLPGAMGDMARRLRDEHGVEPAGFLVEEQHPGGVELLVGVVRRPPFGPVVALGLGGTLAEVLDQVALRLFPLSEPDARDLVRCGPAGPLLGGVRGGPPLDEDALVRLVLALGGEDGLAAEYGDALAELECNPVVLVPDGAVALDARLLLRPPSEPAPEVGGGARVSGAGSGDPRQLAPEVGGGARVSGAGWGGPRQLAPEVGGGARVSGAGSGVSSQARTRGTDFTRLFRPRAVAVAGASTKRPGFGNRALAAYRSMGWTDGLYAIHPTAAEVDGVPARPSVADIDGAVDYLLVAVPAERCADMVRSARGRVPFVHVISGGFGEAGPDGGRLEAELVAAGREAGARVLGPNCIGVYCPAGRQTFQLGDPRAEGTVGVVSQSGGLAGDIIKAGARRGLRFSKLATVGNAVDVSPGELLGWLVDDPETEVVGVYLEGSADAERVTAALRRAAGRVPVALLLGGQSRQGAAAVASHTGSLAGDRRVWRAVADATGTALVTTLEELLAVLAYAQRWRPASGADAGAGGVLVLGVGGGASVLATDACDRAGLDVAATAPDVRDALLGMGYGVGTSLANPVEIPFGPVAPPGTLRRVLDPVLTAQTYADVLVHVNVQAFYSYGEGGIAPLVDQLEALAAGVWPATRLAVVVRNLECAPGPDAERLRQALVGLGLPLFRDFDEASTAIAAAQRFAAAARRPTSA